MSPELDPDIYAFMTGTSTKSVVYIQITYKKVLQQKVAKFKVIVVDSHLNKDKLSIGAK